MSLRINTVSSCGCICIHRIHNGVVVYPNKFQYPYLWKHLHLQLQQQQYLLQYSSMIRNHSTVQHRNRNLIVSLPPSRYMNVHKLQLHLRTVRWNTNTTSGRPPSPRVYPTSATNSSSTNTSATATASTTIGGESAASAASTSLYNRTKHRGPVSWTSLFLVTIAAASAVTYYQIERERRLERAMGKIVSSEYNGSSIIENNNTNTNNDATKSTMVDTTNDGWTPRPGYLAKRKFVATPSGWFPVDDGFGAPGKPAIGGPWSLVDLDGNLVTNTNFEGKWLLLYFGFARCPDICPSEMMKVGRVMDTLKKDYPNIANNIVPIFVSIDPARDSLKALKEYAKDFHPDYIFLTGTPQQVKQMAKSYRVYYSKADESVDGDYLVDHSIVIYFHDATGDLADCFTQSMRPSDVVNKIVERYNTASKNIITTAVTA